eukprot:835530-Prorocentrum_minimum.AAC.1
MARAPPSAGLRPHPWNKPPVPLISTPTRLITHCAGHATPTLRACAAATSTPGLGFTSRGSELFGIFSGRSGRSVFADVREYGGRRLLRLKVATSAYSVTLCAF